MSDLRVPTTTVPVEIKCIDGRSFTGDIFLPSQSSRQPGPMRADEWSDAIHPFFPFRSRASGDLTIVNRDAVLSFAVPAEVNASKDEEGLSHQLFRVAVDACGERFEGEVLIDMPPDHSRVADWLNAPGAFIALRAGATHRLIQKRHVTRVIELPRSGE